MENLNCKNENFEKNDLSNMRKNQFLKVKNSLLELENYIIELKDSKLEDREVKIKRKKDKHFLTNYCVYRQYG